MFKPNGRFKGMPTKMNMPPHFVLVNRIQWGVHSIMAQLAATGNWHAIHREYLYGDAPRTEIGAAIVRSRAHRPARPSAPPPRARGGDGHDARGTMPTNLPTEG